MNETNGYPGDYRSAIARAKRILIKAGFAWSTISGRYSAYGNGQKITEGVTVRRVGCSETVALHVREGLRGYYSEAVQAAVRATEKRAIAALRAGGLPFDDRGWLECGAEAKRPPKRADPMTAFDPVI